MALLSLVTLLPPPEIIGTNSSPAPTPCTLRPHVYHQVSCELTSALSSLLPGQATPRLQSWGATVEPPPAPPPPLFMPALAPPVLLVPATPDAVPPLALVPAAG